MNDAYLEDQKARDEALNPNHSFIVQAPAGSGKTELLIQRYLVLLANAVQSPEEIIAITFTRKAAAEMRERIINALINAKNSGQPEAPHQSSTWELAKCVLEKNRTLNWQLLQNPNRMRILTIDALCAQISNQATILAGFGAQPSIVDNPTEYYQKATQALLSELHDNPPWKQATIDVLSHLDNRVFQLERLFTRILSQREQWLPHIINCNDNSHALKKQLELGLINIVTEAISSVQQKITPSLASELIPLADYAGRYLQEHDPNHPIAKCAKLSILPPISATYYPIWLGLSHLLLTQKGGWRKTLTKKTGFPVNRKSDTKSRMQSLLAELEHHEPLRLALQHIMQCPPLHYNEQQFHIIEALIKLLPTLAAKLNVIFQQHNAIDFIELNLAAQRALGEPDSPTDLALHLDYQIKHLLVDEFQDTSVSQFNLLENIVAGWQAGDGRSIFLVGDPMQSIYRFRNAEVGLFLRAQHRGIGEISLVSLILKRNFRSGSAIVDWVNDAFNDIFPPSSNVSTGAVSYVPSIATQQFKEDTVKFYPLSEENDYIEAHTIVGVIKACQLQNPKHRIAILVRSRNHLQNIIPILQYHHVHYQAVEIDPLAERPEIQDLLSLSRALLHFGDRIAWLSILRAPWCGLKLRDLLVIAKDARHKTIWESLLKLSHLKQLTPDALIRLERMVPVIKQHIDQRARLPFNQWLKSIWLNLGGPACLDKETDLSHTESYFNLLEQLEKNTEPLSQSLIETHLHRLYAQPHLEDNNPLQIMTIHKAKGLEFDHVILPGLSHKPPHAREQLLLWLERPNQEGASDLILGPIKSSDADRDSIYSYLRQSEKQKLDYEAMRLFYVAATRARRSLHLMISLKTDCEDDTQTIPPPKSSFANLLWPHYQNQLNIPINKITDNNSPPITIAEHHSDSKLTRLVSDWTQPLAAKSTHSSQISQEPEVDYNAIDIRFTIEPERHLGTLIHEVLEQIANEGLEAWNAQKILQSGAYWKMRLHALGIPDADLPASVDQVKIAIQNTIQDPRGRWILSSAHKQAYSELALSAHMNNEMVHVIIDRTFIDEQNRLWIIDYKTANSKSNTPSLEFLTTQKKQYELQLKHYARIMQMEHHQRPILLGLYFPLCRGWLEWEFSTHQNKSPSFSS